MPTNVLIILTDEQRFDTLACNGSDYMQTPNLDALASRGVNFQQHRCSSPICSPARASILTGQYARTHGLRKVGGNLPRDTPTLATWLQQAGYGTGIFGKSHLEAELTNFVTWLKQDDQYFDFDTVRLTEDNVVGPYLDWVRQHYPQYYAETLKQGNEETHRPPLAYLNGPDRLDAVIPLDMPYEVTQTAWIAEQTRTFIAEQQQADRPFFAVCSFVDPHHPWTPTREYFERYDPNQLPEPLPRPENFDAVRPVPARHYWEGGHLSIEELQRMRAAYFAMVSQIDTAVGSLMDALEARGMLDDTLIIFTSDHGDYNGDMKLIRKGPFHTEATLHIPLLVSGPGVMTGAASEALTQHVDLVPTVLDLLKLPVPDSVQGMSFSEVLRQPTAPGTRQWQFFEYPESDSCPLTLGGGNQQHRLMYYGQDKPWLTDYVADATECNNLNETAPPDTAQRLEQQLLRWCVETVPLEFEKAHSW